MIITRFAPSPNGMLHLGHAYAAVQAQDLAAQAGGKALLRIEDIDGARSRAELADAFREDLRWLGLEFHEVKPQSTRLASYEEALVRLDAMGVLYPCTCTRAEIAAAANKAGPEGPLYPGTCRGRDVDITAPHVLRLDVALALAITGPLHWEDTLAGKQTAAAETHGDVVLRRKDEPASYHLAATLDDDADGVSLVTRGRDLFAATHIHRLLQALLGLKVPKWHHHALLLDESGGKLAKRRGSPSLADMRAAGVDGRRLAEDLRQGIFPTGISVK